MLNHILQCHDILKTDFVRAENIFLYDSSGRRYVDLESGVWCTALGHNHPRLVQAMHAQIDCLIHIGSRYPTELAEQAAQAVLGLAGLQNGKCVFLSSGSEAVEFAVQAIRRISGKPLVLTLSDSYLAAYGSAGHKNSLEWHCFDWNACASCNDCDPACPDLDALPWHQIGGIVFEPGSASGLVKFPPAALITALVERIRQVGGLVAANEVTTGMGRTGRWFGYQHYEIQPDIVATGKGLGNGYPVSAVALSQSAAGQLEQSGLRYAQSHQNDPLGCAIASQVIQIMQNENLVERSSRLGASLKARLADLAVPGSPVRAVRGRGLMLAVEFEHQIGAVTAETVDRRLLEQGYLVGVKPAANVIRIDPALTLPEEELDRFINTFQHIVLQ